MQEYPVRLRTKGGKRHPKYVGIEHFSVLFKLYLSLAGYPAKIKIKKKEEL